MMQPTITQNMTDALMCWFEQHRRVMPWRGSDDPYHIWVSEMMLQQTQVATVERYFLNWIERFPDVETLAQASLEDVLKVWEGLGYYTRARNFHKGAKYIADHAKDKRALFPETYEDWLKVPGVGPYTAAAVSSIAFKYPAAVVDGNVKRVMARLFCLDEPIANAKYHKKLFDIMNKGFHGYHPGWVNQAWMELGSLQCTPRPDCDLCPLKEICCAFANDRVGELPRKPEKKQIPVRQGAMFIIEDHKRILMVRRPDEGFLGGLWEYPGYTLKENQPDHLREFVSKHHLVIFESLPEIARHTYSHFHQEIVLYRAGLDCPWQSDEWTDMRMIAENERGTLPRSKIAIKIAGILDRHRDLTAKNS